MALEVEISNSKITFSNIILSQSEILGEGGSGVVYKEIINNEIFAVKIYSDITKFEYDKIQYMVENTPVDLFENFGNIKLANYSWPLYLVKSQNQYIGYITPYIHSKESYSLEFFYDYNLSKNLSIKDRVALTHRRDLIINICKLIETLHSLGHYFVDIKPQNIRVYEKNMKVSLLDCDGYSILNSYENIRYNATMVSTDYISPELQKSNLSVIHMNQEQDNFALSVIIFQILNYGIHPYQGIVASKNFENTTNDEKGALYLYPYGLSIDKRISPLKQSVHETFLDETRFLFDRAFMPNNTRPNATEWKEHFQKIESNFLITKCKAHPNDYIHLTFKDKECPACKRLLSKNTLLNVKKYEKTENKNTTQASFNNTNTNTNNNLNSNKNSIMDTLGKIFSVIWTVFCVFVTAILALFALSAILKH